MYIRYIKNTNTRNIGTVIKVSKEEGEAEIGLGVAIRCNKDGSPYQEVKRRRRK